MIIHEKTLFSTFGEAIFEYSKPVDLVRKLVEVATSGDDIILDFFSGSGTTAEAVLKQNEIDKQNRRFNYVQLPEETETDSLAFQRGFKNIAQISIERIKICLSKTNNSNISKLNFENNIELGCRHFKLSNSNFKQWQSNVNNNKNTLIQQILKFDKTENTNSEITNILWELLVKLGFSLDSKVISEQMSDIETIYYNENVSYAFLLNSVSDAILNRIINLSPQNVICLDSLFKNQDSKKTNFILKLEQHNISFKSI